TVIATQAVSMLLAAVLAALTLVGSIASWQVFLIAALRGVVLVLDNPARQALTFRMVGPTELPNAVALNSSLFNAARVVGPALGGVVVATAGAGVCFALNSATFLAVLGGLVRMREHDLFPVEREERPPGLLAGTGEAFASIGRSRVASVVLVTVFLVSAFSFNFNVLLPVLAKETLTAGPAAFGVLSACFGGGALVGALAAASLGRASQNVLFLATGVFGLAQLVLAPQTTLGAASFLLAATGAAFTLWSSNANSTLQLTAPDHLRGRWLSLYYLAFNGSMPLGGLLAGWLAARGGTGLAFTVAGTVALATAAGAVLFLRRPRALRSGAGLGAHDVNRRPDLDLLEEPLGVGNRHADAPVRHRVAERRGVGRAVDPDGGRRDAHPARPERVPRSGRNRFEAFRPIAVRRVPGRIPLFHDDLEGPERGRVLRLAGGDGERLDERRAVVEVQAVRAAADDDD
ncbi:MAG: MFS transporter, partial [Actinomycetota bacterium]|nr:MFS transporter [Actinomycetota bacterium]